MILIFSNSTNVHLGGVEIFNEEFEILLKNENIEFYRVSSITKNKIIGISAFTSAYRTRE